MRTLYLHIGQGKTGTSFLQSCFALSRAALAASGIRYPRGFTQEEAAAGRTTSGNGYLVRKALKSPVGQWAAGKALRAISGDNDLLFSTEFFFADMSTIGYQRALPEFARHMGCDRIKVLMLIRDPVDHVISSYLQIVQRGGLHDTLSEVATKFRLPMRTAKVLETHVDPMFEFTVLNYSRVADDLLAQTAKWLDRERHILSQPTQNRVNRSLTTTETALQRALNARFGRCADIFANEICEATPDLPRDPPRLNATDIAALETRLAPAIAKVNELIEPEHAYRFATFDKVAQETPGFRISRSHLRDISALIATKVRA